MNKIVITGATGMLGSKLYEDLNKSYKCFPLGNTNLPENGHQIDLTNKEQCNSILDRALPDVIIHTAALTDVDRCEREPRAAFQLNVQATRHLVEWVQENRTNTRFIYISTDQVYNGKKANNIVPDVDPVNTYGYTKLWAEDLIRILDNYLVLRTNFYGLGKKSVVNWLTNAEKNNEYLTLFDDVRFNPLYLDHLIEIIKKLLTSDIRGVYNLGAGGKSMSKADFMLSIIKKFSINNIKYKRGVISDVGFLTAPRPLDMSMSVSALETELGQNFPTISDGVNKMYDDWSKQEN